MINIDRKWSVIEPTMTLGEGLDQSSMPWTNNSYINLNRALKGKRYHILSPELWKDRADAYFLVSLINVNIDKEIEFINHAHSQGSKVVLAISLDARLSNGLGLYDHTTGTTHTDLCNKVDAIASGLPPNLHFYARNQHKVFDMGDFVEDLNFSIIPYENRTIDLVGTGIAAETDLPYNIVLYEMLKEKYPEKRFVYAFRNDPKYNLVINNLQKKYPQIEFTQESFPSLLTKAKGYINIEQRPRPGRAVLEAWYHRVPSISSSLTYFSKLYPEFSFHNLSFDKMVECFDKMITRNYYEYMSYAENELKYDQPQQVYNRMISILDKGRV